MTSPRNHLKMVKPDAEGAQVPAVRHLWPLPSCAQLTPRSMPRSGWSGGRGGTSRADTSRSQRSYALESRAHSCGGLRGLPTKQWAPESHLRCSFLILNPASTDLIRHHIWAQGQSFESYTFKGKRVCFLME